MATTLRPWKPPVPYRAPGWASSPVVSSFFGGPTSAKSNDVLGTFPDLTHIAGGPGMTTPGSGHPGGIGVQGGPDTDPSGRQDASGHGTGVPGGTGNILADLLRNLYGNPLREASDKNPNNWMEFYNTPYGFISTGGPMVANPTDAQRESHYQAVGRLYAANWGSLSPTQRAYLVDHYKNTSIGGMLAGLG